MLAVSPRNLFIAGFLGLSALACTAVVSVFLYFLWSAVAWERSQGSGQEPLGAAILASAVGVPPVLFMWWALYIRRPWQSRGPANT